MVKGCWAPPKPEEARQKPEEARPKPKEARDEISPGAPGAAPTDTLVSDFWLKE